MVYQIERDAREIRCNYSTPKKLEFDGLAKLSQEVFFVGELIAICALTVITIFIVGTTLRQV
jgi:hypothetical protein